MRANVQEVEWDAVQGWPLVAVPAMPRHGEQLLSDELALCALDGIDGAA
jgi:hypothetical protein